jgi:hypothetical protein
LGDEGGTWNAIGSLSSVTVASQHNTIHHTPPANNKGTSNIDTRCATQTLKPPTHLSAVSPAYEQRRLPVCRPPALLATAPLQPNQRRDRRQPAAPATSWSLLLRCSYCLVHDCDATLLVSHRHGLRSPPPKLSAAHTAASAHPRRRHGPP